MKDTMGPKPTLQDAVELASKAMVARRALTAYEDRNGYVSGHGGPGLGSALLDQSVRLAGAARGALLVALSDAGVGGMFWSEFGRDGLDADGIRERARALRNVLDFATGLVGGATVENAEAIKIAFPAVVWIQDERGVRVPMLPLAALVEGTSWRVREQRASRVTELVDETFCAPIDDDDLEVMESDGDLLEPIPPIAHPTPAERAEWTEGFVRDERERERPMTPAEHADWIEDVKAQAQAQEDDREARELEAERASSDEAAEARFLEDDEDPDADGAGVSFNPATALADVEDDDSKGV